MNCQYEKEVRSLETRQSAADRFRSRRTLVGRFETAGTFPTSSGNCIVALACTLLLGCSQPTMDSGQVGDPQYPYLYADHYPVPRPGTAEVSFVRWLGTGDTEESPPGLYLVNSEGGPVRAVFEGHVGRPAWLDSVSVCFTDLGNGGRVAFLRVDIDSLAYLSTGRGDNPAAWSADSLLVYEVWDGLQVHHVRVGPTLLISTFPRLREPDINPATGMMAVRRLLPGGLESAISLVDLGGNLLETISDPASGSHHQFPKWSADGRFIGYQSDSIDPSGKLQHYVVVADTETGAESRLMRGFTPSFDHNTTGLFFSISPPSLTPGDLRIYWTDLDGSTSRQITF